MLEEIATIVNGGSRDGFIVRLLGLVAALLARPAQGWASTVTTMVSGTRGLSTISFPFASNIGGCSGRGDSAINTLFPTTASGTANKPESKASAALRVEADACRLMETDNPVPLQFSRMNGVTDHPDFPRISLNRMATPIVSLSTKYWLNDDAQCLISTFWPEKGLSCSISRSCRSPYNKCDLGPCSISCLSNAADSYSKLALPLPLPRPRFG